MSMDLYEADFFGGNELVASGVIHELGVSWAIIKITKKFTPKPLKNGRSARGQ